MACGDPEKTVDGSFIEYYYARAAQLLIEDCYVSLSDLIVEIAKKALPGTRVSIFGQSYTKKTL
jgi:hypothetical protein